MAALLFIAGRRRKRELHETLNLQALAARGSPEDIKSSLKRLEQ